MRMAPDGQRRLQTGSLEALHQLRDVVESVRRAGVVVAQRLQGGAQLPARLPPGFLDREQGRGHLLAPAPRHMHGHLDRKSTRLNSSHVKIQYAAFWLK